MKLSQLDTPVLLIEEDSFLRNMKRMQELATNAGIAYRPHAKAHKSAEIAKMQKGAGAVGVCCAKLGEAEVLVSHDIKDILITTPVIGISKLTRMMQIAKEATISVVVDNPDNLAEMAAVAQTCGVRPDVVIEVDVGQGRCGVQPGDPALQLAYEVMNADWLNFKGLQGYQGAIQMTASFAERNAAARKAVELLTDTADLIRKAGLPVEYLTGGQNSNPSAICLWIHAIEKLNGMTATQFRSNNPSPSSPQSSHCPNRDAAFWIWGLKPSAQMAGHPRRSICQALYLSSAGKNIVS